MRCASSTGNISLGNINICNRWLSICTRMFGGPDSDVLMEVSVPVWSQKDCQGAYIERIADAMVCAGAKEGGRDSCQVTRLFFF